MLNEDKIKLMNNIALYEKKEDKDILLTNSYFKGDFIVKNMLQSFVGFTICYFMVLIIRMLYGIEKIVNTVDVFDVVDMFKKYAIEYVLGLIVFEIITFYICSAKYDYAKRSQKVYLAMLKRLEKRYEFRDKSKELAREGGHNA